MSFQSFRDPSCPSLLSTSAKLSRSKFLLCAGERTDGWLTAACSRSSFCPWRNWPVCLQSWLIWWGRIWLVLVFHSFPPPPPNISLETAGPECVDRNGQLCSGILQVRLYEVPYPIQACVLGVNRFFAYCHKKKLIQRFPLPQVFSFLLVVSSVIIHSQCRRWIKGPVCKIC